jgi:hypothetical protein
MKTLTTTRSQRHWQSWKVIEEIMTLTLQLRPEFRSMAEQRRYDYQRSFPKVHPEDTFLRKGFKRVRRVVMVLLHHLNNNWGEHHYVWTGLFFTRMGRKRCTGCGNIITAELRP